MSARLPEDATLADQRAVLVPQMPDRLAEARARGEQVWDTEALKAEFTVQSFMAPFVIVTRKSDGVRGTLMFTHQPRFYFSWLEDK